MSEDILVPKLNQHNLFVVGKIQTLVEGTQPSIIAVKSINLTRDRCEILVEVGWDYQESSPFDKGTVISVKGDRFLSWTAHPRKFCARS